jgi:hypothetical protein
MLARCLLTPNAEETNADKLIAVCHRYQEEQRRCAQRAAAVPVPRATSTAPRPVANPHPTGTFTQHRCALNSPRSSNTGFKILTGSRAGGRCVLVCVFGGSSESTHTTVTYTSTGGWAPHPPGEILPLPFLRYRRELK